MANLIGKYSIKVNYDSTKSCDVCNSDSRSINDTEISRDGTGFASRPIDHVCLFHEFISSIKSHITGPFLASFSLFLSFQIQLTVNVQYKFLLTTGFKPQTSGIGSNHSTN